jgi:hypothetical protein
MSDRGLQQRVKPESEATDKNVSDLDIFYNKKMLLLVIHVHIIESHLSQSSNNSSITNIFFEETEFITTLLNVLC